MRNTTLIKNRLTGYLDRVFSLGVSKELSSWENSKTRLLNQLLLLASLGAILLGLYHTIIGNFIPATIAFINITANFALYQLIYTQRLKLARVIACLFYPLSIFLSIILGGGELHGEYTFFVVILVSTILFQTRWIQFTFSAYILCLFSVSQVFLKNNPPIYDALVNSLDPYIIFAVSLGAVLFLVNMFIKEVIQSRSKNEALLAELLEANTEFKRLNYMVSHDLRGPLRQIVSFSDLALMANQSQHQMEEVEEHLKFIGGSARRLYTLTEDLLSLARLDNDTLATERFQLVDIVQKLNTQFRSEEGKVDLQFEVGDISLEGNSSLLGVVLQNLIENGIKYNESPLKKITISAIPIDDQIQISVRDNGIGIPPGQEQEIFKMLTRLTHQQSYQGSGIGLAIAQKVIDIHRGEILAVPQKEGALFVITLPCQLGQDAQEVDIKDKKSGLLYKLSKQRRAVF